MALDTILMVGCGNMAGAMLQGWLAGGLDAGRFTVADPAPRELPQGVRKLDAIPADGEFDAILLGVKPQLLGAVAPQVERLARPGTVLVSILAGVELAVLADRFPRARALVRVMPNLSAALGKSPMALATVDGAAALAAQSPHDPAELARRVASPGGTTQAGLDALDEGDSLRTLLEKTLRAASDRSAEMAAEARREG